MNKAQFRHVRTQLGLTRDMFGDALGLRKETIAFLETGIESLRSDGQMLNREAKLDHIMSYACAWLLLNNGPVTPWPKDEDATRFRAFMTRWELEAEMAGALFGCTGRQIRNYANGHQRVRKHHLYALCWMNLFGTRDPFHFPLHKDYDPVTSQAPAPIPIRPAKVGKDYRTIDL